MTCVFKHIIPFGSRKKNSSIQSFIILCLTVLLFSQNTLFAQVISNTGAAITVSSGIFVNSKDIENISGSLGNNGTINLSGNYQISAGTLGNNGTLNLDGTYTNYGSTNGNGFYNLKGQWVNFGSFNAGTSTVTFNGTTNQTINNNSLGEAFYNLTINNSGSVITQIANPGNTLGIQKDLNLTTGSILSLHSNTSNLTIGGKATIYGSLLFNGTTVKTTTIGDNLSGSGLIDMSGGALSHLLNLAGATNAIGTFTTSPTGSSTVNYNGTNQTVFAALNYRNLIISNSGVKTLQGNSLVGIDLNVTGGTFDLGTTTTSLGVSGSTNIAGSLSFNGTSTKIVSLTGNLSGSGGINMSGGNLPHLLNLNGTANTLGSYSSGNASTVKYTLNGDQSVFTSDDYRNLTISGSGVKTLYDDITAKGILTMSSGDINANGNTLKITNSATTAIARTSGKVIGKLQRAIGVTSSEYLYPLGSVSVYNPLKMTFQNLTAGPLTAQFKTEDIGANGLPLDDNGNEIWDTYETGFWSLTAVAPMASNSFNVNLNHTGFSGIDQSASIIKRTNGGNLQTDGTHGTITSSEITRTVLENGISTNTTDFAIGRGRPRITLNGQPKNIDVCEGSDAFFEVTARGRGTLTYQWYVDDGLGSGFVSISDGVLYTQTTNKHLIIHSAPYSMNGYMYQCIITDGQGHTNTTNPVLLTVNKIPIATATPTAQDECPGVAFANIVLGTSNNVTGTTFAWSRDNPAGITTSLALSGTAIGDQISGAFSNTTDAPVTVTFTIIPTGPLTTYCVGNSIAVTVTVNPTPRVFASPASSTQCDSTTTSIRLTSPSTFTGGLISYKYTVTTSGTVTGFTTPTAGLSNNHYITDKLVNLTDHYQIVTYRVVPISPVGCIDGPAIDVTVTVNPTPRVIPINLKPAICFGGTTEIVLTTPTVMTVPDAIRFDYTVSFTGVPGDVVGDATAGYNLLPGQKLMFTYQNSAPPSRMDTVSSVLFAITPKAVGFGCNTGNIVTPGVEVHPQAIKFNYPGTNGSGILITKPLTCDISTGLAALRVMVTKGAGPYHVSWTGPVGYSNDSVDIKNLNLGKYTVRVTDNLNCYNEASITVVPFTARPQILATPIFPNIHVTCPGGSNGSIRVYVSSGITAPYFFWVVRNEADTLSSGLFSGNYNPADTNTFKVYNNLKSGNYMLVIRDVNGCEVPKTTELKEPAPITAQFQKSNYNGFNVSCLGYNNGSVLAQAAGGNGDYSYQWYAATGLPLTVSTTTSLLDSVSARKYYLRTIDKEGCMKMDSVTLSEPDGMILTGSELSLSPDGRTNISCNKGNDGFIKISISGGSGVYNYSWTSSNGYTGSTKDISGLKAGTYTCIVSDMNGCIMSPSQSFTLTEPSSLDVVSVTSVSNDLINNINCNGGTGWINITVSGGSPGSYKYNWSTTDGSGIINGQKDQLALTAGTYHLSVTDLNNCEITRDITLTQPASFAIQLSATNITCVSPGFNNGSINLTVSGGVAPYTYLWSNGKATEDLSGLTQGLYQVTVTYNISCMKTDTISVNLPPVLNFSKSISDFNGYNISCNSMANGSIQVNPTSGLAPFVYKWTGPNGFSATTQDISDIKAGQYVLLITDNNFCTATETINLTEPGKLDMALSLSTSTFGGFNINCTGDKTGFIGIEPLNQVKSVEYLWSDGVFGKTRMNLSAGEYSVILSDANNCQASSTIKLTEPDSMKLIFEISSPFCPDKPDGEIRLSVTGGVRGTDYLYKWSDNSTGQTISNILKGFYKVIVKDMNGCSVRDSVRVEPLNETCLIIPNAISPNSDLINDVWNIGMIELYPQMEIKIFNRWGETIWRSEKGYPKPWDGRSNGYDLPIDSYHYIIDLHNGSKPLVGNVTIVR